MRDRMIRQKFWASMSHPEDPWARLLFVAMWNWADDWGVGTCNPRELLGYAFPYDRQINETMLEVMLRDIGQAYGVVYYTVSKRPYYSIPSWPEHQKVNHPSASLRNPGPERAETWLYRDLFDISSNPLEDYQRVASESRAQVEVERELEIEPEGEVGSALARTGGRPKTKRGTRIPEDYMPSPAVVQAIKAELGVNDSFLLAEHRKFCDYWAAKTGATATKLDWDATWRNWIRRASERPNSGGTFAASGQSAKVAGWAALGDE